MKPDQTQIDMNHIGDMSDFDIYPIYIHIGNPILSIWVVYDVDIKHFDSDTNHPCTKAWVLANAGRTLAKLRTKSNSKNLVKISSQILLFSHL